VVKVSGIWGWGCGDRVHGGHRTRTISPPLSLPRPRLRPSPATRPAGRAIKLTAIWVRAWSCQALRRLRLAAGHRRLWDRPTCSGLLHQAWARWQPYPAGARRPTLATSRAHHRGPGASANIACIRQAPVDSALSSTSKVSRLSNAGAPRGPAENPARHFGICRTGGC
jgi:hypothetical protein